MSLKLLLIFILRHDHEMIIDANPIHIEIDPCAGKGEDFDIFHDGHPSFGEMMIHQDIKDVKQKDRDDHLRSSL